MGTMTVAQRRRVDEAIADAQVAVRYVAGMSRRLAERMGEYEAIPQEHTDPLVGNMAWCRRVYSRLRRYERSLCAVSEDQDRASRACGRHADTLGRAIRMSSAILAAAIASRGVA